MSLVVAIFEDSRPYQTEVRTQLTKALGDVLIRVAGDMDEALNLIQSEEVIHIATVDGNLDTDSYLGDDGREIEFKLRAKFPDVKIVEVSGFGTNLKSPDDRLTKEKLLEDPDALKTIVHQFTAKP